MVHPIRSKLVGNNIKDSYGICRSHGETLWICAWILALSWARLYERLTVTHASNCCFSRHQCCAREVQNVIQLGINVITGVRRTRLKRMLNGFTDWNYLFCQSTVSSYSAMQDGVLNSVFLLDLLHLPENWFYYLMIAGRRMDGFMPFFFKWH